MTPSAPAPAGSQGIPIIPGGFPAADKVPPPGNGPSGPQFQNGKPGAPDPRRKGNSLFDPNRKSDPEAANKILTDADKMYKAKNHKKAFELYQKAFAADPKNGQVVLRLARLAFEMQDPISAHDYISFYIDTNPDDWKKRGVRLQVNEFILQAMEANFKSLKDNEKAEAQQIVQQCVYETLLDNAIVLANTSSEQIEGLKKNEKEMEGLHKGKQEDKLKVLGAINANIQKMTQMIAIAQTDPKNGPKVRTELTKIASEAYGLLFRFANADEDPEIKKLAPSFEASYLLAQGKVDEAQRPLQTVRSEGYKKLGDGDEAKGREKLLKLIADAKKLMEEKKPEEAQKLFADVSPVFYEAHVLLERIEGEHLLRANQAVMEIWKKETRDKWNKKRDDANSGFAFVGGSISAAFRGIVGDGKTTFDDINEEIGKEEDLHHAVMKRLNSGSATTIKAALEDIKAKESGALKDSATELLASSSVVNSLITYTSTTKTDAASERAILSTVKTMGVFGGSADASNTAALIQFHSRDAAVQKEAEALVEKDKLTGDIGTWLKKPEPAAEVAKKD